MKLSIITASFNSEKTISKTIESLLNQSCSDFEYIIIDGSSSDNTLSIIKSYENQFKEKGISYRWISENDRGIYDAFNKGIEMAEGNWISFIGSDDYYLEKALENYVKILNPVYDIVYSNVKVVKGLKTVKTINGIWSWKSFRRKMTIAHVGAFHNKVYFNKYGFYDLSYKIAGDYELLLRAKENLRTTKLEMITAIMSADGISNNQIEEVYKETTRAKIETGKLNQFQAIFDYNVWTIKYQCKKIVNAIIR
jgi:glycosyltransferase involved in cell wall biosynthesis